MFKQKLFLLQSCHLRLFALVLAAVINFLPLFVHAQTISFPTREQNGGIIYANALSATASVNVLRVANDQRSSMVSSPSTFASNVKYKSNNTLVKFGVYHETSNTPTLPYVYKLVYKLEGSKVLSDSGNIATPVFDTLVISYNPDSLPSYQDLQIKVYPGYYNAKLSVVNIYDITNSSSPTTLTFPLYGPVNFFIELAMQYQPFARVPNTPSQMNVGLSQSYNAATKMLRVSWAPATLPAFLGKVTPAQYELEWTYADNYDRDGTTLSASDVKYDFRHNATRIITDSEHYNIPVIYPKGYIIYRVRMVRVDETTYRIPVYGNWCPTTISGSVSGLANAYQITTPHTGDDINWNYTISFAESGKNKHVVSYFDGLLKNRQTITRFNSKPTKLLVTENIYDYEGRPSITTLPSVVDTGDFTYQGGVSISSVTNQPYFASDFDLKPALCPDEVVIPPFKESSLANRYYSPLNTDTGGMQKFVPRANGYPFVHTQLSPGYEDRVDRSGGAGDKLQIGMGHATENVYVNADQPDLNRLFGINVGFKAFYNKTVTTDPNKQSSMSVKDYEGKLMSTSLIGAPDTTTTALMINDEIPLSSTFKSDQLANTPQLTVGHQRIYNGNFFMDYDANAQIRYEYIFKPYQVCPAPSYLGLSVAGKYDYTVTDKCGTLMLHRAKTLGTTGVTTSSVDLSALDDTSVFLDKGKYTIDKTLTVNTDDIYAAVDSFFNTSPSCAKTEDDFIKEEVLRRQFPCPDSLKDPCAQLKKQMMEELFPETGKYGTYDRSGGMVLGLTPSIFDLDELTGLYRYQNACVATALNSLIINKYGRTYLNLRSLPVDTFLFVFSGADRYKIAEQLLPLHPEYCRLKGCFVDTFETKLKSIPNSTIAIEYGMFDLDDIVTKDIQLRTKMLAPAINMVGIADSLKTMFRGVIRMDTFAAEMAFCLNDDSTVFGDAKRLFHDEIVNLDFPSIGVKDVYFDKLKAFYLANREKYVSIAKTGGGNTCEPCDSLARMQLRPPPLVNIVYNTNGSFNTGAGGLLSLFSGSLASSLAGVLSAPSFSQDSATVAAYRDTAMANARRLDSQLNYIAIDSMMSRMVNCFANSGEQTALRNALIAIVTNGEVHNGTFLPHQLRAALSAASIAVSDLCHPYLVNYDFYDDGIGARGNCSSGTFYESVKNFLNNTTVLTQLQATTTTPSTIFFTNATWISSNIFADKIVEKLNGTPGSNIYLTTRYNNVKQVYNLYFYRLGGATVDTVIVSLRSPRNIVVASVSYPLLKPATGVSSTIYFSNVACYYEDPQAYAEGHIGRFEFRAMVDRQDGTDRKAVEMLGWTNGTVYMNSEGGSNPLANSVPCNQFKAIYKNFADTMRVYDAYAADHPLFYKSLRNFMNYSLKKVFGQDQYNRFLQSCALADSMEIPAYGGYGKHDFGDLATFNTFKQTVYDQDSFAVKTIVNYNLMGRQLVIIDYANIPYHLLRKFNQRLLTIGGQIKFTDFDIAGLLFIPTSSGLTSDDIRTGSDMDDDGSSEAVEVQHAGSVEDYTLYRVINPGLTYDGLSKGIARIRQNLYDNNVQGYWIPNFLSTVNQDYYLPEKQGLLAYTYGLELDPDMTVPKILDNLQPDFLEANVPAFSGTSKISYSDPTNPYRYTNLFYTTSSSVFPGYSKLKDILDYAKSALSTTIFIPATQANNTYVASSPAGTTLTLYRCSDGLYWYRFFDANARLYNVYVRMPEYISKAAQPNYRVVRTALDNGDSATRAFVLTMTDGPDTLEAKGSTDFDLGWSSKLSDVLLGTEDNHHQEDPISGMPGARDNCEQVILKDAIYIGKINYRSYIDSFRHALKAAFYAHVMGQIKEKLIVEYADLRFATTLYNYDLAGNLIQTVPPEGVHKLGSVAAAAVDGHRIDNTVDPAVIPVHSKVTRYAYNTANQPLYEVTPDAGQKYMYYDKKGNVIASQSAKQRSKGSFTYMLYDGQNRLNETGEVVWGGCPGFPDQRSWVYEAGEGWVHVPAPNGCACENTTDSVWQYCINSLLALYTNDYDNASFASVIRSKARSQVVVTIYDSALIDLSTKYGMSRQENLRSRVGANLYFEQCGVNQNYTIGYVHAAHYSYDVNGNVQTLVRDIPELQSMDQRYKRVDYEYDLLSGKVNMLAYNRGATDQFYQRYEYDDDNRITLALTSRDGVIWKRDAGYTYYDHGPLARLSLGDHRVQGIDYAYTLQGWLKAINGDAADTTIDLGRDGRIPYGITPKDVYATTIDYFKGDYYPIGNVPITSLDSTSKSLYNGNIARQTTDVAPFGALTTAYTYDQLNRIRFAKNGKRQTDNTLSFNNWYASAYRYDQDGNLKALMRRDSAGTVMDNFSYYYPNSAHNNRLADVLDSSSYNVTGVDDIKHHIPTVPGTQRMLYDEDGNLIKDLTSLTDTVKWNIYGKTTDIENDSAKLRMHFVYDGAGQRVSKNQTIVTDSGNIYKNTYYVRDATGNILAEYNTQQMDGLVTGGIFDHQWTQLTTDPLILIESIHDLGYDLDERFRGHVTSSGGGSSIPHLPGYYLNSSAELYQQYVTNYATPLLLGLCEYGRTMSKYPVGDATLLAIALGDDGQIATIADALFSAEDEDIRRHVLAQMAATVPGLYLEIAAQHEIDTIAGPGDSAMMAAIMYSIASDDPSYYIGKLQELHAASLIQAMPVHPLLRWLQAVAADELYYDEIFPGHDITSLLTGNLVHYGSQAAEADAGQNNIDVESAGIYGYANSRSTALSEIEEFADGGLEQVSYDADPVTYMTALATAEGPAFLDGALDSMATGVNIPELYNIMANKPNLVGALGNMPFSYDNKPIVKNRQISLTGHHLYGSSRLGIAGYWPGQIARSWDYINSTIDTFRLCGNQAWYSGSYNDVIEKGKTTPFGFGVQSPFLSTHLRGQKQYELTNHLGNVQATVSDARYVISDQPSQPYRSNIIAAYDYYPFGMLMPKRFVTDTATRSAAVTRTITVPQVVTNNIDLTTAVKESIYATMTATSSLVTLTGQGGNVYFTASVAPMGSTIVKVSINYMLGPLVLQVSEYRSGGWFNLKTQPINYPGIATTQAFIPTTNSIRIKVLTDMMYEASSTQFTISNVQVLSNGLVPQNIVANITNVDKDRYEFGFNGQQKVNEIAGTGNHNTALFWEYDTRTGRRWNIDPVRKQWESSYATFGTNPITSADVDGDDAITINRTNTQYTNSDGSQGGSSNVNWSVVKCAGEDTYTYICTNEKINADGETNVSITKEQLHPEKGVNDQTNFGQGKNVYLDGLIVTDRKMYDYEAIGTLMNSDKEFNSYMQSRNSNAKSWASYAFGNQAMAKVLPIVTYSAAGGFGNLFKGASGGYTVNGSKFDYFFGRVTTGDIHNIQRSAQNLKDLNTLGVNSTVDLLKVFDKAFAHGVVTGTKVNQYGTAIIRTVNLGEKGSIDVTFFYQFNSTTSKPSITTIIPKIFKQK